MGIMGPSMVYLDLGVWCDVFCIWNGVLLPICVFGIYDCVFGPGGELDNLKAGPVDLLDQAEDRWQHIGVLGSSILMGGILTIKELKDKMFKKLRPADVAALCNMSTFVRCIILRCIILRCIFLRCIFLRCIFLRCIILRCIILHCIILRCIFLRCIFLLYQYTLSHTL